MLVGVAVAAVAGVDDYGGVLARLRRGLPGCEQFTSCGVCCSSSAVVVVVGEACPGPAGSETAAANLTCNPVGTAKSLPRLVSSTLLVNDVSHSPFRFNQ